MSLDWSHAGLEPVDYEFKIAQVGRWRYQIDVYLIYANGAPAMSGWHGWFYGHQRAMKKALRKGRRYLADSHRRWASEQVYGSDR